MNPSKRPSRRSHAIRRRLLTEQLENRQLLAADNLLQPMAPGDVQQSSLVATSDLGGDLVPIIEIVNPDLVQFAKDLTDAGVVVYGAAWCPACSHQAQLFGDGGDELPFVEVTNPDRSLNQIGIDNDITSFPTWVFPDGSRQVGILSLSELTFRSEVPVPTSITPSFKHIADQVVAIGSPLHLPIDAYNHNRGEVEVTVQVSDPSLLEAAVISGNRSARFDMKGYGDMVFELFEHRAPTATGRFIELAESGFYDDIIIHRIIDNFVIQGGDPTGTGTSGSSLDDFDDDFHPELQHNRDGVLSYAKSSDDTNNSQFFVTEVPTRFLDFNYSVFGQLVEGENVREAISEHAVNGADRPTAEIAIESIDIFTDLENSVIMLKPTGTGVGSTNVTVTVTSEGRSQSQTFTVDVETDTSNSQPFLNPIQVEESYRNDLPATIQISSTDIEGDAVQYLANAVSAGGNGRASIDENGLLTVTPDHGFTGSIDVMVSVEPGRGVTGNSSSDRDNQLVTFNFVQGTDEPPTNIITPDRIHQLHSIPASTTDTAIIFRATDDATISVHSIGTVSLTETIQILDKDTNPISELDQGVTTAMVTEGELYAIVFEPQPTDRLVSIQSSAGVNGFSTTSLSNLFQPTDVNGDGQTTPRDALSLINRIALQQASEGEQVGSATQFNDVNGDGKVSIRDALFVINHLNRNHFAEGESTSDEVAANLPLSAAPNVTHHQDGTPESETSPETKSKLVTIKNTSADSAEVTNFTRPSPSEDEQKTDEAIRELVDLDDILISDQLET